MTEPFLLFFGGGVLSLFLLLFFLLFGAVFYHCLHCNVSGQERSKFYTIKRTTTREASVYLNHRGPSDRPPEPLVISRQYVTGWFQGVLNWAPITARDASLSDDREEKWQPLLRV